MRAGRLAGEAQAAAPHAGAMAGLPPPEDIAAAAPAAEAEVAAALVELTES